MALPPAARAAPTRRLYQVLRALHRKIGGRFDDLFEAAQGAPLSGTIDPYSNIKRGNFDRHRAAAIHEWLAQHHFEFAQAEAPDLFQYRRQSEWERFIEAHALVGGVKAIAADQLGIARRDLPAKDVTTFRIGQKFLFALSTAKPAHVVAFEHYADTWHPLPLGEDDRHLRIKVPTGETVLPRGVDGRQIPLMEHDDTGLHRFVFVLCFGPKPRTDQQSLIIYGQQHELAVHQAQTRIIT